MPIFVYRDFARVGGGKMPDAKTMGRWGLAVGPEAIKQVHERIVTITQDQGVVEGRRMRVDTTVVETNVHYPTDSSLLGDGVRVLIRTMKKITKITGQTGTRLRDRSRSVKLRVLDIARAARSKAKQSSEKLKSAYGRLLNSTSRVVGQAKRFSAEIASGVKRAADPMALLKLQGLRHQIEQMVPLVKQVMKQTRARIYRGDTHFEGKLLSVFEPSTEVIRKGKAGKPNEFGKMVKLQEAENQIVTDFEVYNKRPNDCDLLVPAIEIHQAALGRVPHLIAADAGFYSGKNETAAKAMGVKRVSVPNRSTKSAERRREQKTRSTRDLLNILDEIAKRAAGFKSLADAWADTTTPHGRLMLTVLAGLAEFERELIRARTGEGRARAKAEDVHMGRPPKLTQHQRAEAISRRDAGETLTEIARTFGVSHTTIGRL